MLQAKLVVVGGETKTQEIELKQLPAVLGRSREAAIKLPHPLVSRNHCELLEENGMLYVRDLGSLNGTYVGSQRVDGRVCLEPESLLTIGTVTFRAVYEPNGHSTSLERAAESPVHSKSPVTAKPDAATVGARPLDLTDTQAAPTGTSPPASQAAAPPAVRTPDAPPDDSPHHDTNPSVLDLDQVLFEEIGSNKVAPVLSSIAIEDSAIPACGSVSLSAIAHLPQPSEQLSFAGGIQDGDGLSHELIEASRIVINTDDSDGLAGSAAESESHRPLPR
jgi:pSer/pThr/pTyr-binding forkhead associated (FHA) protein